MNQPTQTGLLRGIRRWDLVAIALNGIIGAGIFGLPSKVYALLGPYSLLAFAACALVVALIILCFAEVASRYDQTGGPYLYGREACGPLIGFEVGWLTWLARVTAFAANCNLLIQYLSFFWPAAATGWTRAAVISVIVAVLTAVNIAGIRNAALFSDVFTIGKLLPIILFIVAGLFFLEPQGFSASAQPSFHHFSQAVLLLVYAFTGFEMAVIPAGEARNPRGDLPFAILVSLGLVALLYVLIQVVCIGTLPALAASNRPLADAAQRFLGTAGAGIITVGVIVSVIGNLSVLILAGARLPFAMACNRELPRFLAMTHERFRTPHPAILLTAALMLALTLAGTFIYALTISTIARLLGYTATCVGAILLRRREKEAAPFTIPAGTAVAVAALGLIAWLLSHSSGREARDAALAVGVGLLIYATYKLLRREAEKVNWEE
jgi:amino acid transporter